MPRIAPNLPADSDILCEACGYTLNGLPDTTRCPECGKPVIESIAAPRVATAWERPEIHRIRAFIRTTATIIFRPAHFYRTLATRVNMNRAQRFARAHWFLTAILLGLTACLHVRTMGGLSYVSGQPYPLWLNIPIGIMTTFVTFFALDGTTLLAARLTHWEATYRGYRLPINVVRRGLFYHAAHYLPVALIALITVVGYRLLVQFNFVTGLTAPAYLYVLAVEVVLAAIYLFQTYWIGMRNMMYANR